MTRKEGFIEVDKMLEEIGVNTSSLISILNDPQIRIVTSVSGGIHFSFYYKGETYYYKHSVLFNGTLIDPYSELVAGELAEDFGISHVNYDLATIGFNKGVLSKNFKKKNNNYIIGSDVLGQKITYYDLDNNDNLVKESRFAKNTLEDVWDKLEERYQNYNNKKEIVNHLMNQLVNIYIFDIITSQVDRHKENWQIIESDNSIDIEPIYDNERILVIKEDPIVALGVDFTYKPYEGLYNSIKHFQNISSSEFTDIIKDKLYIIEEENLNKVFDRIEKKTGYPMPQERKEFYLNGYKEHREKLGEILGLTQEREEPNERKNR